jgi:hypothetical protein
MAAGLLQVLCELLSIFTPLLEPGFTGFAAFDRTNGFEQLSVGKSVKGVPMSFYEVCVCASLRIFTYLIIDSNSLGPH